MKPGIKAEHTVEHTVEQVRESSICENDKPDTAGTLIHIDEIEKDTADVRGEILGILTDANCKGSARNREVTKVCLSALANRGSLYYHTECRDFDSAMIGQWLSITQDRLLVPLSLRRRSSGFVRECSCERAWPRRGCTMRENLPPMDPTTRSGLINYKEALLNLACTITASRLVDCIDFIVETEKETRRG